VALTLREIDLVVVKRKTEPVAVYEILDFHTETSYPHMAEALRTFRLALGRYRSGKWSDAKQGFADVLEMNPDDKAAKLYIDRCEFFQKKAARRWLGRRLGDARQIVSPTNVMEVLSLFKHRLFARLEEVRHNVLRIERWTHIAGRNLFAFV